MIFHPIDVEDRRWFALPIDPETGNPTAAPFELFENNLSRNDQHITGHIRYDVSPDGQTFVAVLRDPNPIVADGATYKFIENWWRLYDGPGR